MGSESLLKLIPQAGGAAVGGYFGGPTGAMAGSQIGSAAGNSLFGQQGGGMNGGMTPPAAQPPRPFPQMTAPDMQQANIGTPAPVGVPMAGAMQRSSAPMQQAMMGQQGGMPMGGMGQPPPGSHAPVNPGADPNSLLWLQIMKLMNGQG